ncbi:hypothetical protein OAU50_08540 [Planctomycetota bacterium]|nr:hypothetical protein [Planctomycetota bacterium]
MMFLLQESIAANAPMLGDEGMHWVIKYMLIISVIVIPIVLLAFWKLAKKLDKSNVADEQWDD